MSEIFSCQPTEIRDDSPYPIHPLAAIFPAMTDAEFESLKSDIKANGLHEPIWLYDGKVLDGRHRQAACFDVGVGAKYRQYDGDDPLGFVWSLNFNRRHMTDFEKAECALKAKPEIEARAKARQQTAGGAVPQKSSEPPIETREELAKMAGVSHNTIGKVVAITESAAPELLEAVRMGDVSINAAADIVTLPAEEQAEVVAAGKGAVLATAKNIRAKKAKAREAQKDAPDAANTTVIQGAAVVAVLPEQTRAVVADNDANTAIIIPRAFITAAYDFLGAIDTDPASTTHTQKYIRATTVYLAAESLSHGWAGRVWLHVPDEDRGFMAKAVEEFRNGHMTEGIVLTRNTTDAKWFQQAARAASAICLLDGRTGFCKANGEITVAHHAHMLLYFGKRPAAFANAFNKYGIVVPAGETAKRAFAAAAEGLQ